MRNYKHGMAKSGWILVVDQNQMVRQQTKQHQVQCYIAQVNPAATDGVYWILLPSVGAKQVYCMMDPSHLGGGGWMLAWKCTRGSTFHYDTNYWTTTNTYNETSQLNRNDGDHKNHVFNYYVAGTLGAVFPDINNGGQSSVGYNGGDLETRWCWTDMLTKIPK